MEWLFTNINIDIKIIEKDIIQFGGAQIMSRACRVANSGPTNQNRPKKVTFRLNF